MKHLTSLLAIGLLSTSAYAGELPSRVVAPVAAPIFTWTGLYVGGTVGYGMTNAKVGNTDLSYDELTAGAGSVRTRPAGFAFGPTFGFNIQAAPNLVVGLETDYQWTGQSKSATRAGSFNFGSDPNLDATYTVTGQTRLNSFGTLRARLGFVPTSLPQTLLFVSGGLAYGSVKTSLSTAAVGTYTTSPPSDCEGGCAFTPSASGSSNSVQVGWALGAGIESVLFDRWTWKAEYLHVDLGKASGTINMNGTASIVTLGTFPAPSTVSFSNRVTNDLFRIGLNYRFGP